MRSWPVHVLVVCLLLLIGAEPARAQSVQFGAHAGGAVTSIWGTDSDGAKWRASPSGGIDLVIQSPSGLIGFATGASFVSKGSKYTENAATFAVHIGYIDIPAVLRLAVPLANTAVRPVLMAGASVGIKSGCKIKAEQGPTTVELNCDDTALEGELRVKPADFGVVGGLAIDIPIGDGIVVAPQAVYTLGVISFDDTSNPDDVKNSALQFQVSVRFR